MELSRANSVRLLWVPGHSEVIGNEEAARLAYRGTKGVRATHYSVGLPEEKGMSQAKLLIGEQPSKTCLAELRKLER